ncbi:hypothetical protein [Pseudonocardia sp. GCM10023141]|uniref:hypothetical protein n=1 Tax=Pseudonocardia sp. GCM10023141 TaxID=3252653 RepID=UPI00361934D3
MSSIPDPPVYEMPLDPTFALAMFGSVALVAVVLATRLAVRNRDPLPVAACVGAMICAFNEPIFDVLAKIGYPVLPPAAVAYTAFGRSIPWFLVIGYIPWVGLVPYVVMRRMHAGLPRRTLYLIAAGLCASVAATEIINAAGLHAWAYYGQTAWRGHLGGGTVQMAAMPLVLALIYYVFVSNMGAGSRIVAALPLTFAATTWPLYVSNYSDLPEIARWGAAALSVALCLAVIRAVAHVAEGWATRRATVDVDQPALERTVRA